MLAWALWEHGLFPARAADSSPQYLLVGSQQGCARPWRVIRGGRTCLSVPAGRRLLQHGVAATLSAEGGKCPLPG